MINLFTLTSLRKIFVGTRLLKPLLIPLYTLSLLLLSVAGYGQTSLPASHEGPWRNVSRAGYTANLSANDATTNLGTSTTGGTAVFSASNTSFTIHFNNVPGTLTYFIRHNGLSSFTGIFTVQESANGSTWSTLRSITSASNLSKASAGEQLTDYPASATRFIRFFYTERTSQNIMIDMVQLGAVGSKINVRETSNISNGGSYSFGSVNVNTSSGARTFTIENTGALDLTLTGNPIIVKGGTNASEFTVTQPAVSTIVPGGSATFTVSFNPISFGSKSATISIANNDANGNPFTINLAGSGSILAPSISSISPTSGPVGSSLVISGTNLINVTEVRVNTTVASFTINNDNQITAIVPVGATTGAISAKTSGGTATSSQTFTVIQPPVISSISPISGYVGGAVTITGSNFSGATQVAFNGTVASFTVVSATQITATVPAGATTGTVSVTTPGGTATSSQTFTVLAPAPVISSISPTSGSAGDAVTITGSNFLGATQVAFNGTVASFTVVSATQITATVPVGATTGTVAVTTPGGTATSSQTFTVINSGPVISSFSPVSGPVLTIVTITGTGFQNAFDVSFNGVMANFEVQSDTGIMAEVPSGATTGPITVTTSAGTAVSSTNFVVEVPVPAITGISPSSGTMGDIVIISGANFTGVTNVSFNGTTATFMIDSNGQITTQVPSGAASGPIAVTAPGGTAQSETFTVMGGPVISSFSPVSGPVLTIVTITGTGFQNAFDVSFNGVMANFEVQSDTGIMAEVPSGATTGPITVTASSGSATSSTNFVVEVPVPAITSVSPTAANVGDMVVISGANFSNVTSVTFNGVAATFIVDNGGQITTQVPAGATTGMLVVTAPGGSAQIAFEVIGSPVITVTGTLNPFGAQAGTFSAPQSYQVSGTNITSNITVTAPAQFQVSLSSGSGYGSSVTLLAVSGTVATTTVYARYAPTATGSHSGDISHATTGAASKLLAVSGSTDMPTIAITGTYTTVANQEIFIPTSGQQFSVSGTNLTASITITAPQHYELSSTGAGSGFTSSITIPQSGGSVPATNFWIRYNPASLLGHPGTVVASSTGAANFNIPVTGNAVTVEPTDPSYIVADNPTTGSIDLTLVALGNGQKRIIVARQGAAVNANPADGTTYTPSATFGSGSQTGPGNYVVYVGTGTQVTVTGLGGGTTYYFAVYDFNDEGLAGAENYLSDGNIAYATTITATYVWNTSAGNWDEAASWSPLRTSPSPTDILVFDGGVQASPVATINFNATKVIGQLKFVNNSNTRINVESTATLDLEAGAGQTGDDLLVAAGSSLRVFGSASTNRLSLNLKAGQTALVHGAITLEGTGSATHRIRPEQAGAITFENGSTFTAGVAFSGNAFGLANAVVFKTGSTYVHKSEAVANVFGPPAPNTPVLAFESGSTYRHESTIAPDLNGRTYGNFVLDHASFNQANLTGSGNLTVENLTVTAGTAMGINLTGTVTIRGDVAVNAGTLSFTPGSANVVHLNGTGDQTISGSGTLAFGPNAAVQLGTAAVVRLEKNMAVNGSLSVGNALHMKANVISGTGSFGMGAGTTLGIGHAGGISLAGASGNIQMEGQRTYSTTGNYIYNGAAAQLTGDGLPNEVNNLTINNAAGVTSNGSGTLVKGALALQSGRFTTSASNSLTVAQTGSISGGSPTAFVNGPLAQVLINSVSNRQFPIGKGSVYLPVNLSVSHTDGLANTYTAEQFNAGPGSRTMTGDLKRVSGSRYFNISKSGSSALSSANVTIGYNNDLEEATASNLRIGKSSGSNWVSIGGSGSAPGTGAGTITSGSFTTFSDFVLASIEDEPAPLPVSLLAFTGAFANGQVNLHWVTASEQNNRHFEVERSSNGLAFQKISTVAGAGTTSEKRNYASVDRNPLSGTSYYRLKQVDFNGAFVFSKVIAIRTNQPTEAKVYPNPTTDILQVDLGRPATNVKVMVVNMVGQVMLSQEISGLESQQQFTLDVSRLSKGTYQLVVQTTEFKTSHKFVKINR